MELNACQKNSYLPLLPIFRHTILRKTGFLNLFSILSPLILIDSVSHIQSSSWIVTEVMLFKKNIEQIFLSQRKLLKNNF